MIKMFSRSSPNHRNSGVERMAMVTMFTRSASPKKFQMATTQRGTRPNASQDPTTPAVIPLRIS